MKKSDLPWILPLLQAFNEGKTLQVREDLKSPWVDWETLSNGLPMFNNHQDTYRIKPELKTPGKVAWIEYHNSDGFPLKTPYILSRPWEASAIAVIKAFKAGELELPEELK